MAERPPIPEETRDRLLVSCIHSCCICGQQWVQIHHIDEDPTNNDENNLIPLCRNHAGMVHMKPPAAAGVQSITPSQLQLYKENWIAKCRSITPTNNPDFEDLRAKVVKLEGDIQRIAQNNGGN